MLKRGIMKPVNLFHINELKIFIYCTLFLEEFYVKGAKERLQCMKYKSNAGAGFRSMITLYTVT